MVIDESRRNGQTIGIDSFRRAPVQSSDLDNLAVLDSYIGYERRQARAINDATASYQQVIIHFFLPARLKVRCLTSH